MSEHSNADMSTSDATTPPAQPAGSSFVLPLIVIGAIYSLLVAITDYFFGKDAAGLAGTVLTALFTKIYGRYPNLRIMRMQSRSDLAVPVAPFSTKQLAISVFIFFGLLDLVDSLMLVVAAIFNLPELPFTSLLEVMKDWRFYLFALLPHCAAYFLGGFFSRSLITRYQIACVAVASLIASVFAFLLPIVVGLINKKYVGTLSPGYYTSGVFCLLFVFLGTVGGWFGNRFALTPVVGEGGT